MFIGPGNPLLRHSEMQLHFWKGSGLRIVWSQFSTNSNNGWEMSAQLQIKKGCQQHNDSQERFSIAGSHLFLSHIQENHCHASTTMLDSETSARQVMHSPVTFGLFFFSPTQEHFPSGYFTTQPTLVKCCAECTASKAISH